jgi:hypothetical protein
VRSSRRLWVRMDAPPPPPNVLAALPPGVVAFIHWQAAQIERLTARIVELETRVGKDSSNSSKPPSKAHPHAKPLRSKSQSKRPRGGQRVCPENVGAKRSGVGQTIVGAANSLA